VPEPRARPDLCGATVLVLGTAWAAPLAGLLLHRLGARVVRVDDPRRVDPFPLRDALADGQERITPDLATATGRDALGARLASADLIVDGYTPRVLANAGFADAVLARDHPRLTRVRVAAFATTDRPGYGPAAECRGGWAARHDPPRLGRSSVADPVVGFLAALEAVTRLEDGGGAARVSLEGAVGHLLAVERGDA
jgi:crotonobetainyl-CoA:carnitine CoA-transferase CaiB-like acyl-CoA transferase